MLSKVSALVSPFWSNSLRSIHPGYWHSVALRPIALRGGAVLAGVLMAGSSAMASVPVNNIRATGDVTVPTETGTSSSTGSSTGTTTPNPGDRPNTSIPLSGVRFSCRLNNGQYTVMYQPESQPDQAFPWAIPSVMGGGWSSDRRCNEIARRLEFYRPDGLTEMMTGVENGYNTICVTTEKVPTCRIVLTVPNGQDPIATRDRVFENLAVADSGQMTQGINTYTSKKNNDLLGSLGQILGIPGADKGTTTDSSTPATRGGLNLRPFLDKADGGTGERLSGGVKVQRPATAQPKTSTSQKPAPQPSRGRRLNPRIFR
ncbi:MAG: COP23 domain-containing protein [Synechococcales bacterium]|nr:COP23 domain-containing protein [Synechococcales bacterium]